MDILYLLVPLSVIAMLAILGVFAWALQAGQLEDLDGEGARILQDDEPGVDAGQSPGGALSEQSMLDFRRCEENMA
jgi:cbb3-type cytochrome oxidase maturation protein